MAPIRRPPAVFHCIGARQDEAVIVASDLRGEPVGRSFGADEDEDHLRVPTRCRAGPSVDDLDLLELFVAVYRDNLCPASPPGCWPSSRCGR